MGCDGVEIQCRCAGRKQSILSFLGCTARVGGSSVEGNVQLPVAEEVLTAAGDGIGRQRPVLRTESHVHGDKILYVVQMAFVDDGLGAVKRLFCRLENQPDLSLELCFSCHQLVCNSKTHGRVGIVAAGMDRSGVTGDITFFKRSVTLFPRLIIRQAVDIKAEGRHRAVFTRIKFGNDTRIALCSLHEFRFCALADGSLHGRFHFFFRCGFRADGLYFDDIGSHKALVAHPCQNFRNPGAGSDFSKTLFRVLVKFSAVLYVFTHRNSPLFLLGRWLLRGV